MHGNHLITVMITSATAVINIGNGKSLEVLKIN